MKAGKRVLAAGALLLAAAGLLACPAQMDGPPPGPPSGPDSSAGSTSSRKAAFAADYDMAPIEAGFTPCCVTDRFRFEIECGERLKRCYENNDGVWRQTYGRHCKEHLGESCYYESCESRCE